MSAFLAIATRSAWRPMLQRRHLTAAEKFGRRCPPVANWTHGGGRQGGRGRQAQGAREARHSAGDQGQGSRNYFTWFETRPPAKGPKKDPCTRSSFRRAFSSAGQKRDRERAGMPALLLTAASWHRRCTHVPQGAVHGRGSGHRGHQVGQAAFASLEDFESEGSRPGVARHSLREAPARELTAAGRPPCAR